MEEIQKHGGIGLAALRAGMDRKTARKYVRAGKLPSELRKPHTWRTRADPFAEDWAAVVAMLEEAPELEARTLFDHLAGLKPEAHTAGQLRTLQRRIRQWRAQRGPEREIFFPQAHRPGEAIQTDFTHATGLGVTIGGEPFDHQLCHSVLPCSNWEWATVCHSESMAALRRGVQSFGGISLTRALSRAGRDVPLQSCRSVRRPASAAAPCQAAHRFVEPPWCCREHRATPR